MSNLSVIIPPGPEAILTQEWVELELSGTEHEVIIDSWDSGAKKVKKEFVCFLENDCVFTKNYFLNMLDIFDDKPRFRKLAMVSPVLAVNDWDCLVYGFKLEPDRVMPRAYPSSRSSHLVQIAYLPGSIIRTSSLGSLSPKGKDTMLDSINFSLYLWNHGQRLILQNSSTYCSTQDDLDMAYPIEVGNEADLQVMFNQEMIG